MREERALFRNAYALMAATVRSSVLGMGFWAVAARLYDTDTVGRASAAISAMLLRCNAAQLNRSVGMMRFLPVSRGTERRVILVSYGVAACAGLVAATGFLLIAPLVSGEVSFLPPPPPPPAPTPARPPPVVPPRGRPPTSTRTPSSARRCSPARCCRCSGRSTATPGGRWSCSASQRCRGCSCSCGSRS